MTAALEYVCRKLPPERDNPAIRKYIAEEIVAACKKGKTALGDLNGVGLNVVNSYLFPPALLAEGSQGVTAWARDAAARGEDRRLRGPYENRKSRWPSFELCAQRECLRINWDIPAPPAAHEAA
jgi:hypothetical protein